jgi:hypothetical protein
MKTVTDILRDADPLPDDMRRLEEERDRLRQTVVAAASDAVAPSRGPLRTRKAAIVAVSVAVVALAAVGLQIWSEGGATLQAAVRFEVRLAEERPTPGLVFTPLPGSNRVIYLHHEIVVTNGDISQTRVLAGNAPAQFWVGVDFSQAGAQKIRRATANHIGRPVAILIDGEVVAVPVLRAPISESAVISGGFTRAEAERIADGIGVR